MEKLNPLLKQLFDYVKSHDLLHTACGRIELDGDNLFINNSEPTCLTADQQVLEVHRKYIDVHILLEGKETIGWKALEDLEQEVQAYDEEKECALYADRPTTYIDLASGTICHCFSGRPSCSYHRKRKNKKINWKN